MSTYAEAGRWVDLVVDLLLLRGTYDEEVTDRAESVLHVLSTSMTVVVAATVSERGISLCTSLLGAGWHPADLGDFVYRRDPACLAFLRDMLSVRPIATFDADDVLVGLQLVAVLRIATCIDVRAFADSA